jgi:hypothetical protein
MLNGGWCGGFSQRRKVAKGMARGGGTTKYTKATKGDLGNRLKILAGLASLRATRMLIGGSGGGARNGAKEAVARRVHHEGHREHEVWKRLVVS